MRILTVQQPWADCIIHHGKNVENRTRNLAGAYRGDIAIHAGLRFDENARVDLRAAVDLRPRDVLTHGAIIGVVELVDVHHWSECLEGVFGCTWWGQSNAYHHHVLARPRPLAQPIPYRGSQGLRRLDDATAELLREDLE